MVRNSQTKTAPNRVLFLFGAMQGAKRVAIHPAIAVANPSRRLGMESASAECNQFAERELYVIEAKDLCDFFGLITCISSG